MRFSILTVLFFSIAISCSAQSTVTLTVNGTRDKSSYKVPTNIRSLYIRFEYLKSLPGIEKLKNLESLVISFNGDDCDYAFLKGLPLKRLVIENTTILNLRFLSMIPTLEEVMIDSCTITDLEPINLSLNPKLRVVILEGCFGLKSLPFRPEFPPSLQYLWIQYNEIESIPARTTQSLAGLLSISFYGNPVSEKLISQGLSNETGRYKQPEELPQDLQAIYTDVSKPEFYIKGNHAP
jgi:Leucine-rich repeat (LRR) protein